MAAFDRLRGAYTRLRGVADVKPVLNDATTVNAPQKDLERFAQMAALSCTALCRQFIKQNMAAAGVNSTNLTRAIDASYAYFWAKRGIVRFRLAAGLKNFDHKIVKSGKTYGPYIDKRENGPYVMQASLDAGYVYSPNKIGAKAKRRLKAGVADFKTTAAVNQVHMVNGRWFRFTRGEINKALLTIVPGKNFWTFTPGQEQQIAERFRKNFFGLVQKNAQRTQ